MKDLWQGRYTRCVWRLEGLFDRSNGESIAMNIHFLFYPPDPTVKHLKYKDSRKKKLVCLFLALSGHFFKINVYVSSNTIRHNSSENHNTHITYLMSALRVASTRKQSLWLTCILARDGDRQYCNSQTNVGGRICNWSWFYFSKCVIKRSLFTQKNIANLCGCWKKLF